MIGTMDEKVTGLFFNAVGDFPKKHHGKIWVKSILKQGTPFHTSTPVVSTENFNLKFVLF